MSDKVEIHISDIRSFRSCRRKWYWSSRLGRNLEPAIPYAPFFTGKAIHAALEFFYEGSTRPEDTIDAYLTTEEEYLDRLDALWPMERQKLDDEIHKVRMLIDHYFLWQENDGLAYADRNLEFIEMERAWEVPIQIPVGASSVDAILAGRFDGYVKHKPTGRYFVFETKTARSVDSFAHTLATDQQCTLYQWAAERTYTDHKISGTLFNIMSKSQPKRAALTKSGTMSKNKKISTTWFHYVRALREDLGLSDSEIGKTYGEFLTELKKGTGKFFRRHPIERSKHQMGAAVEGLLDTASEMLNPDTKIYASPGWMNCIAGSQRVLMADLSWKPIKDIEMGDMIMGKEGSYLQPTKVLATMDKGVKDVITIGTANNSITCTSDHKLWANNTRLSHPKGGRHRWLLAKNLGLATHVRLFTPQSPSEPDFKMGWMAGYIDGDGSFYKANKNCYYFKVVSMDPEPLDQLQLYAKEIGITLRNVHHTAARSKIPALALTIDAEVERLQSSLADTNSLDYARGYLAGMYDAEGHLDKKGSCRLFQSMSANPSICERIELMIERTGLHVNIQNFKNGIRAYIFNIPKFLSMCPPVTKRKYPTKYSMRSLQYDVVEFVKLAGSQHVYDLTTECHSFIVEGFTVHNCNFCLFKGPCIAMDMGGNYEALLEHEFHLRSGHESMRKENAS